MKYKVQKGPLPGHYATVFDTADKSQAWAVYFKLTLERGEKKRIQEIATIGDAKPVTLKMDNRYWTRGRGER